MFFNMNIGARIVVPENIHFGPGSGAAAPMLVTRPLYLTSSVDRSKAVDELIHSYQERAHEVHKKDDPMHALFAEFLRARPTEKVAAECAKLAGIECKDHVFATMNHCQILEAFPSRPALRHMVQEYPPDTTSGASLLTWIGKVITTMVDRPDDTQWRWSHHNNFVDFAFDNFHREHNHVGNSSHGPLYIKPRWTN